MFRVKWEHLVWGQTLRAEIAWEGVGWFSCGRRCHGGPEMGRYLRRRVTCRITNGVKCLGWHTGGYRAKVFTSVTKELFSYSKF